MKLVVLSDDRNSGSDLETEHGLSLYLETDRYRFLLDTGCSSLFIRNAERMGIDLNTVDYIFLSHAHDDHTGGLSAFLELNTHAHIILSPAVTSTRYFSTRHHSVRSIGLPFDLTPWMDRCLFVTEPLVLDDGSRFFSCTTQAFPHPKANATLWMGQPEALVSDVFDHELVACIGETTPLVFIGCAHKGVLNILSDLGHRYGVEPSYVMGGFHLLDSQVGMVFESADYIRQMANWMSVYYPKTRFITGHCTGDVAFDLQKDILKGQLEQLYVGLTLLMN